MDIKFGISTNDQLSDQILCSIIASDFVNDTVFSAPKKEEFVLTSKKEKPENNEPIEKTSKETIEDDIIPNFLEGKNFN